MMMIMMMITMMMMIMMMRLASGIEASQSKHNIIDGVFRSLGF